MGQTKSGAIFWQVISALSSTSFRARANTACPSSFIDGVPAWRTLRHYPLSRVNCILILRYSIRHCGKLNGSQSPKSGQLHSNTLSPKQARLKSLSQSPKSGQLHSNHPYRRVQRTGRKWSQSPKSGQLHSNPEIFGSVYSEVEMSQSPKSGQLHSNRESACQLPHGGSKSQSPKSGQLHSNNRWNM